MKRVFLSGAVILIVLIISSPLLDASEASRTMAIHQAFVEAETKTGIKGMPEEYYRQKLESEVSAEAEEEEFASEYNALVRYMPSCTVGAMPGRVGILESETEYSYELKVSGKLPVGLSLSSEYISIKNTTPVELPAHLTGLSSGVETTLPLFQLKNTYLRLNINPGFYTDNWNIRSSSFRIPVHSFFIYQPDKKWTFIAGVAVRPDFSDKIFPILGFIYKPGTKWEFNLIPENPNISYALNGKLALFAEGGFSGGEFEVAKDNLKNVLLRYNAVRLGAGLKYKPSKFIQASISTGGVFNRSLEYRESLGKVVPKDGLYTELRIDMYR